MNETVLNSNTDGSDLISRFRRVPPYLIFPLVAAAAWGTANLLTSGLRAVDLTTLHPGQASPSVERRSRHAASGIPVYMPRTLDQAEAAPAAPPQSGGPTSLETAGVAGGGSVATSPGGGGGAAASSGSSTTAPAPPRRPGWLRREVRRIVQRDLAKAAPLPSPPAHGGLSPHAGMIEALPGVWRRIEAMPELPGSPEYRREAGIGYERNPDGTYRFRNGWADAHGGSDAHTGGRFAGEAGRSTAAREAARAQAALNPYAAAARIGREYFQGRPGFGGGFGHAAAFGRFGSYGGRSFGGGGHGHR